MCVAAGQKNNKRGAIRFAGTVGGLRSDPPNSSFKMPDFFRRIGGSELDALLAGES